VDLKQGRVVTTLSKALPLPIQPFLATARSLSRTRNMDVSTYMPQGRELSPHLLPLEPRWRKGPVGQAEIVPGLAADHRRL